MTELEEKTDQQSSIKISRNAKGDYAWECKVYADDGTEAMMKLERYVKIAKDRVAAEVAAEGRGE